MTEVVLFDVGGVLVQLGGVEALRKLAAIDSEAEVLRRWLSCSWVRQFERGLCSEQEFAAGVVQDWALATTPEVFLDAFAAWPEALYEGALQLLDETRARVRIGCLSNTNLLHWSRQAAWGLADRFDWQFLSYQLGMIKPDREIFEHAIAALGVPAGDIVFLDDNAINVEQAAALGLDAVLVRGAAGARRALQARGLIATSGNRPEAG